MVLIKLGHEYFNLDQAVRIDDRGEAILIHTMDGGMWLIERPELIEGLRVWLQRTSADPAGLLATARRVQST